MKSRHTILLFTKPPRRGRVKTRLIGALTPAQAAEVHRACLQDAVALVDSLPRCAPRLVVASTLRTARKLARSLRLSARWRVDVQSGRDLGQRMQRALHAGFRRGAQRVLIVGADTPWMTRPRLRAALRALAAADVVLGPTDDGGYYLVGARRLVPEMFRGIPWGTSRVLLLTLRALRRTRARVRLLPRDFDLDTPRDLRRAEKLLARGKLRAPALKLWLENGRRATRSSRRRAPHRRSKTPRPVRA